VTDRQAHIPRLTIWWLLGALALVVAPHLLRLPLWISALIVACVVWRVLIFNGRVGYPNKYLKMFIVFLALPLTVVEYRGSGAGLDAAVWLLILGTVFKLLEMRERRDMLIVVALCYVLTMVGFIYSQTIMAAIHALFTFVVITGALVTLQRDNPRSSLSNNGKLALRLVAQAIPLAIVLFVLVPRVAPLWTMPVPVSSSKTGVTDEMSPGNISSLSRSAELAFRVSFENNAPLQDELYWRGLVLDFFDGRTWRRAGSAFQSYEMIERFQRRLEGERQGEGVDYDVILEPTQQSWIYALQLADFDASDILQDRYYTLHTDKPVTQRFRYQMSSFLNNETDLNLAAVLRARALQLPEQDGNPRSYQLAESLRAQSASDLDYADRVMAHFREQPFYYTLTPPQLGEASIDDFLFNTREGFCEHYASSFVYLMRAAGVPARVVVGYQGGEINPFEGYTMVYQYNAHAWAEIWLEGQGWVRMDPTAAVAPERISEGAQAVMGDQPGFLEDVGFSMMRFRNTEWLNTLRLRLDAMDYAWNRWVVSYDEDLQLQLLAALFGDRAKQALFLALGVSFSLFFIIAAFFLLGGRRRDARDQATRLYLRLAADLADNGIKRQRGEGPLDFATRVAQSRPDIAVDMSEITALYVRMSYAVDGQEESFGQLRERVLALRLRLSSPWRRFVLRSIPALRG
jgi:transglutaminase-like putative cysteine protease/cbb3-type cytochrome oxidase subunit 3